ncbi:MAG: DUF4412 domain-containing protein [Pseudomonadota bacterium]
MRSKYTITVATVLLTFCCGSALAVTMEEWAREFGIRTDASYDATRVMETSEGAFRFKERKAPGKSAMEMNMGGMQGLAIIREDLQKAWFVMPGMGMYREMDMREARGQQAESMQVSKVEEVGQETIDGFSTRKFKSEFKDAEGKGTGFMWITDDGVPIKMDMVYQNRRMKGERMLMYLEDLKMRAQSDEHFELPAGVKPLNFGAMMGMGGQMPQQPGQNSQANRQAEPAAAGQEPSAAEELGDAVIDETQDSVEDETRKSVRKGIRGLFRQLGN